MDTVDTGESSGHVEYTALEVLDLIDKGNSSDIEILASDDEEGGETTARFSRIGDVRDGAVPVTEEGENGDVPMIGYEVEVEAVEGYTRGSN